MNTTKMTGRVAVKVGFCAMSLWLLPSMALGQTSFYQGKTITLIQARTPGGSGDLRVRAIVPVLSKHIPGNPSIVMQFMDGFGGRKAANHVYKVARPDGLTIANLSASTIPLAVLGESGIEYDIDKFAHLGTFYSIRHTVFITGKAAGLDSLEKLRSATGVRIGEQSVGFPSYIRSRFFAWLLGLKNPKFVTGYSSPEIDVALMQGEVDARQHSAGSLLVERPDWIKKKLVDLHVMMEVPEGTKHPDFAHVPEIGRFARTERERKVLAILRSFEVFGQPTVAPPGVPQDRVALLQEAFRRAYNDPEFHRQYKKLVGEDPSPLMPEDVTKVVKELPREAAVIGLYKDLAGAEPLPPREENR
jgi:tripartite-type tricarboxylate transporter receptor subunit TctC